MLLQEIRARAKQTEAIKLEQVKRYKKASSFYSMAKQIWSKVNIYNSKSCQDFCDVRKSHCENMASTVDSIDDDDEYF